MSFLLELAERGILPDALIRMGIWMLDRVRLMTEARPDCEATQRAKQDFLARMRQGRVALVPEMANHQHYEVPPEFFRLELSHGRPHRLHSTGDIRARDLASGPEALGSRIRLWGDLLDAAIVEDAFAEAA